MIMFRLWLALTVMVAAELFNPGLSSPYPLDGYVATGIGRLEAARLVAVGERPGKARPPGELLPLNAVELRLINYPDLTLPAPDPAFNQRVKKLLGANASRYGIAVLDLSDLQHPRYAEINGNTRQNPGSVGKILVALGIFQALADVYPDDVGARRRVLREAMITADGFSHYDHHTVRLWNPCTGKITRRPIKDGDRASLWTYLDWMMSPSSNSAAGMIQKHLMLLVHYGKDYPVSEAESARFFKDTPKTQLRDIFSRAIQEPITRNGLDIKALRQGSFFTRVGKQNVPGTSSYATSRELLHVSVTDGAGQARGRVLEPRNQTLALCDGTTHPLCLIASPTPCGGLLQIRVALQMQTGSGFQMPQVPRQCAQFHELGGDRRIPCWTEPDLLSDNVTVQRA